MSEHRSRFPHERHQQMIDLIVELKRVGTTELAAKMGISLPTVRRDVAVLEQAGLVSRTHGGVVARGIGESTTEPLFLEKLRVHQNLKTRIGAAAAATVDNNKVVILDSGTTSLAIARELAGRPVTVVAMDLEVAEAAASGATEVHVLGGRIRNGYYSIVGSWMADALKGIRADVFFMAADAIAKASLGAPEREPVARTLSRLVHGRPCLYEVRTREGEHERWDVMDRPAYKSCRLRARA